MANHPIYACGRCCKGLNCKFPQHELRPAHKCEKCSEIIHVLCGHCDEKNDKQYCSGCFDNGPTDIKNVMTESNKLTSINEITVNNSNKIA